MPQRITLTRRKPAAGDVPAAGVTVPEEATPMAKKTEATEAADTPLTVPDLDALDQALANARSAVATKRDTAATLAAAQAEFDAAKLKKGESEAADETAAAEFRDADLKRHNAQEADNLALAALGENLDHLVETGMLQTTE